MFEQLTKLGKQLDSLDKAISNGSLFGYGKKTLERVMDLFMSCSDALEAIQEKSEQNRAQSTLMQHIQGFNVILDRRGAEEYRKIFGEAQKGAVRQTIEAFYMVNLVNQNQRQRPSQQGMPILPLGDEAEFFPPESDNSILERIKQYFIDYFKLPEDYQDESKFKQFLYRAFKLIQLPFVIVLGSVEFLTRNALKLIFLGIRHPSLILSPRSYSAVMDADENLNPLQRIIKEISIGVDNFVGLMFSIKAFGDTLLNLKRLIGQLHNVWTSLKQAEGVSGALKKLLLDAPWEKINEVIEEISADPYKAIRYITELALLIGSAYASTYLLATMVPPVIGTVTQPILRSAAMAPVVAVNMGVAAIPVVVAPVVANAVMKPILQSTSGVSEVRESSLSSALVFLRQELKNYHPIHDAEIYADIESEIQLHMAQLGFTQFSECDAETATLEVTIELLREDLASYDSLKDADIYWDIQNEINRAEIQLQTLKANRSVGCIVTSPVEPAFVRDRREVSLCANTIQRGFWAIEEGDELLDVEGDALQMKLMSH